MRILAFDTSTNRGGAALLEDEKNLSEKTWSREGSHGELLTPILESCLAAAGLSARDLDAIAVGHGPGSFTGVRVSVNAARALSYALNKPVFAFDTTEILAASVRRTDLPIVALVNAHKNMLFTATYAFDGASWQRTSELGALTLEEVEARIGSKHLCIGDGYEEYEAFFSPELKSRLVRDSQLDDQPSPVILGRLAWLRRFSRPALGWKDVQALYIRASGAEEKLREDLGIKSPSKSTDDLSSNDDGT